MKKRVVRIPGVTLRLVAVVVAVIYLAGSIAMVPAAVEQAGARLAKAPAFAKQPVSLTVCERYPASFSVTATGDAPFFTNGDSTTRYLRRDEHDLLGRGRQARRCRPTMLSW